MLGSLVEKGSTETSTLGTPIKVMVRFLTKGGDYRPRISLVRNAMQVDDLTWMN